MPRLVLTILCLSLPSLAAAADDRPVLLRPARVFDGIDPLVGAGGGPNRHSRSSARSPRNRSTEWIETELSISARLQTLSQG
jgi:hypothetical protein